MWPFGAPPPPPSPPPSPFESDLTKIASYSLVTAAAFSVVHICLDIAVFRCSAKARALSPSARSDLIIQFMWLLGCSPLPVLYGLGMPSLAGTIEDRWHRYNPFIDAAMLLHIGSSLYECGVYAVYGKPWVFTLHHVITIHSYVLGVWLSANHFWGAWAGLVEATNVPVCFLKISVHLNIGRGTIFEMINGAVLYLSYILVRLISLPCLLTWLAHDAYTHHELTFGYPGTFAHTWIRITSPLAIFCIWLLSVAWFKPIHKGMMKVIRGKDPLKGDGQEEAFRKNA